MLNQVLIIPLIKIPSEIISIDIAEFKCKPNNNKISIKVRLLQYQQDLLIEILQIIKVKLRQQETKHISWLNQIIFINLIQISV